MAPSALRHSPKPLARARRVTSSPQHLIHFEGGNALSGFRTQALLPKLQAISSLIKNVAARHVHWVCSAAALDRDAHARLEALLRYGDAYTGPTAGPTAGPTDRKSVV